MSHQTDYKRRRKSAIRKDFREEKVIFADDDTDDHAVLIAI